MVQAWSYSTCSLCCVDRTTPLLLTRTCLARTVWSWIGSPKSCARSCSRSLVEPRPSLHGATQPCSTTPSIALPPPSWLLTPGPAPSISLFWLLLGGIPWCRDRALLTHVVDFASFVMTKYSSWDYLQPATKWLLACRSLRILVSILRDFTAPEDQSGKGSPGRDGMWTFVQSRTLPRKNWVR